jgi:hypothetical protein
MAARTKGLTTPQPSFAEDPLPKVKVSAQSLIRVSTHNTGEPHFGTKGMNRFDDHNPVVAARYGTCYFGLKLETAIAETLLHDVSPKRGHFQIHPDLITSRYVVHYKGGSLTLANLTGADLKRLGAHSELTGTSFYKKPQKWSKAIYDHPDQVDGFVYMSRHLNTEKAVVLFDRAIAKIKMDKAVPLPTYPGFAKAARLLGIRSA